MAVTLTNETSGTTQLDGISSHNLRQACLLHLPFPGGVPRLGDRLLHMMTHKAGSTSTGRVRWESGVRTIRSYSHADNIRGLFHCQSELEIWSYPSHSDLLKVSSGPIIVREPHLENWITGDLRGVEVEGVSRHVCMLLKSGRCIESQDFGQHPPYIHVSLSTPAKLGIRLTKTFIANARNASHSMHRSVCTKCRFHRLSVMVIIIRVDHHCLPQSADGMLAAVGFDSPRTEFHPGLLLLGCPQSRHLPQD